MFTGIIEELGIVKSIEKRGNLLCLGIAASFAAAVKIGDSISVSGTCLTVAKIDKEVLFFDAVSGTQDTTNLVDLRAGEKVNLEQALKANDRLAGHVVTGHIDATGIIRSKETQGRQAVIEIEVSKKFMPNMVDKGSIAVDGISLTIAKIEKNCFTINVIPHTLKATTLDFKRRGDSVNLKFDVLSKYVSQNSGKTPSGAASKITNEFLREHGFLT